MKNFQFHFAPIAFKQETLAWRAVIHLNLVCVVNSILDLFPTTSPPHSRDESGRSSRNGADDPDTRTTDEIKQLRTRLRPRREVESILSTRLAMGTPLSRLPSNATLSSDHSSFRSAEVVVRSGSGWKALSKLHGTGGRDQMNEMRQIITACRSDIVSLWESETVQSIILDREEFDEHPTTL